MYKSNYLNFLTLKYMPALFGVLFFIVGIVFIVNPDANITDNGIEQLVKLSDSIPFFLVGIAGLVYYAFVGQRVVRLIVDHGKISFTINKKQTTKHWREVTSIKKYWIVFPPLYTVRFENDPKVYFFNTGRFFIALPFYVFDLSGMGNFISEKKRDWGL